MNKLREDICEIGRRLYNRELVSSCDGNISIRVDESSFLITPTMMNKGFMKIDDISLIDLEGNVINGTKLPSSEFMLHSIVYKNRKDINAVVHAHPVTVSAFAVIRRSVTMAYMPEAIMSLGEFHVADYAKPGTNQLAESIKPFIEKNNGCILSNHGAVTWADNIYKAYNLMEQLEFYCKTVILAEQIGKPVSI